MATNTPRFASALCKNEIACFLRRANEFLQQGDTLERADAFRRFTQCGLVDGRHVVGAQRAR
jgi:hypothetical protein